MMVKEVELKSKFGLHIRPATLFAQMAKNYGSRIEVECNGKTVEGKSVISLLTLEATEGSRLCIRANGADEQEAMKALLQLVDNCFQVRT